ncbi:MAG: DUF45 domain-containing protein [Bacilli bacterium]|nr:DUF45 domain-containing protein [Bacilli bacterium]
MKINVLDLRGIPYKIRRIQTKRIAVVVKSDAVVYIRCYKYATVESVVKFVEEHIKWIEEQYLKYYKPQRDYKNNERYLFLGKEYIMHVVEMKKDQVMIEGNYLVVYTKNNTYAHNKKIVEKFIKDQREEIFNMLLNKCFEQMKHLLKHFPKLEFKKYKSRWGCCYVRDNLIILNKSLIHLPINLIELVIFHELTHFIHPNHNKQFYSTLGMFVKDPKKVQKELKKYSTIYE